MSREAAQEARALLHSQSAGVLSTISLSLEGFPFGSVTPYCIDDAGQVLILISTIAEHTKNITADSRCSLLVQAGADDVQAHGRTCIVGNMLPLPVEKEALHEKYYRYFPKSRDYHKAHNFHFYQLQPVSIRYIGGFGKIFWLEPADFRSTSPFRIKEEAYIVNHMNEDHAKDLISYCAHYKQLEVAEADVRMVGIDAEGFDLFAADKKLRFAFETPISSTKEARERLVAMSREARE